jgi:hypothetical protein
MIVDFIFLFVHLCVFVIWWLFEKTKPIYSFCVLHAADCVWELKKQTQFPKGVTCLSIYTKGIYLVNEMIWRR